MTAGQLLYCATPFVMLSVCWAIRRSVPFSLSNIGKLIVILAHLGGLAILADALDFSLGLPDGVVNLSTRGALGLIVIWFATMQLTPGIIFKDYKAFFSSDPAEQQNAQRRVLSRRIVRRRTWDPRSWI